MAPDSARIAIQRNAELIINRLSDYLSVRFDLAIRVNPLLKNVKQDILYHELASVRRCLLGEKLYGPKRMVVTEVILGDDEKKRKGLMSPTDQTSIQVELVHHCQGQAAESTRGQVKFNDLKTFYAAINPDLAELIDLFETWMWWDILDSAELVRFEQKLATVMAIRKGKLTPEARDRYATLIHAGEEDAKESVAITDDDVMQYEIRQLIHICEQWAQRRQYEWGYQFVLKREELPMPNQGELIHTIAEKVREYDAISSNGALSEDIRYRYAPLLRVPPDKVTNEAVLEYLKNDLMGLERQMVQSGGDEPRLGAPYNYKEKQLEQMVKWLQDLRAQTKPAGAAAGSAQSQGAPPPPPPPVK